MAVNGRPRGGGADAMLRLMRFVEAGGRRLVALEPELEVVRGLVEEAGFECKLEERPRQLLLEIRPADDDEALLLFDAADSSNLGWFSRCQFYVDGYTGAVLQTPFTIANCREHGEVATDRLQLALSTEVPVGLRMPGNLAVNERDIYGLLFRFLSAMLKTGVAVCGRGSVEALAGVYRNPGSRGPRRRRRG